MEVTTAAGITSAWPFLWSLIERGVPIDADVNRHSSQFAASIPANVPPAPPAAMAANASTVTTDTPDRIVTEAVRIRYRDDATIARTSAAIASVRLP